MGEEAIARVVRASQGEELREAFRRDSEFGEAKGVECSRLVRLNPAAGGVVRTYEPVLPEVCHPARATMPAGRGLRRGRGGTKCRRIGRSGSCGALDRVLSFGTCGKPARGGVTRCQLEQVPRPNLLCLAAEPALPGCRGRRRADALRARFAVRLQLGPRPRSPAAGHVRRRPAGRHGVRSCRADPLGGRGAERLGRRKLAEKVSSFGQSGLPSLDRMVTGASHAFLW